MKREDGTTSFSITISYQRRDEAYTEAIIERLRQLSPALDVSAWYDRGINTGESWEQEIKTHMSTADVVIMLVSHSYLTSEFINNHELDMIDEAASRGARVFPVLIGECAWELHPRISRMQFFSGAELVRAPTTKTFGRQVEKLIAEIAAFLKQLMLSTDPGDKNPTVAGVGQSDSPTRPGTSLPEGMANKGSQLQTQAYVNLQEGELTRAVTAALPGEIAPTSVWWHSPLASESFAEHKDEAFLDAVGLSDYREDLEAFWPRSGPRWDALATVDSNSGRPGVILAEGKSYPKEMESKCAAKEPSWSRIAESIGWMQEVAGLPVDPETSMRRHYQLANRLAHVYWLREKVGINAWLVLLLFSDDLEHRPTSTVEWKRSMGHLYEEESIQSLVGDSIIPVVLPALGSGQIRELWATS